MHIRKIGNRQAWMAQSLYKFHLPLTRIFQFWIHRKTLDISAILVKIIKNKVSQKYTFACLSTKDYATSMHIETLIFSMYKELLFTRRIPCICHHSFLKSSRKDELQSYRSVVSFIYFIYVVFAIPAYNRRSTTEMLTHLLLFTYVVFLHLLTQRHYITKQSFSVLFFID